jgi:hypothetical protein
MKAPSGTVCMAVGCATSIRRDQRIESDSKVPINGNSSRRILYTGEFWNFTKYWHDRLSEGEMLVYLKGDRRFVRPRHRLEDINECRHEIGREKERTVWLWVGTFPRELFTTIIMPQAPESSGEFVECLKVCYFRKNCSF